MSRLYCWLESDTRQTSLTARANQNLKVTVNWGSRDDSKRLFVVNVTYPKNQDRPTVEIEEVKQ